jgi:hypothetical protein
MVLCTGEVTAKERTASDICLKIKPDSNDKMNKK